jgi:hypothetical protein
MEFKASGLNAIVRPDVQVDDVSASALGDTNERCFDV